MKKHFNLKKHFLIFMLFFLLSVKISGNLSYYILNESNPSPLEDIYFIRPLPQNIQDNTSLLSLG